MEATTIKCCKNGHSFIDGPVCPFCGESIAKTVKASPGDCVDCGNLCPGYAYGCNQPMPLKIEDEDEQEKP